MNIRCGKIKPIADSEPRKQKFNFVGRILGPRGMTAKQLEQETGCKIMVRGKGSMRDKKKEDANRGKPNWEHLADELHVLLTVEDTENRAKIKLARAVEEVKRLLVPQADGEDELKKRQLMELAIINGTYRDSSAKAVVPVNGQCLITDEEWRRVAAAAAAETQRLLAPGGGVPGVGGVTLRTPTPLGPPLILSPRMSAGPGAQAGLLNGSGAGAAAGLLSPGEPAHQLIYASPYAEYANYAALTAAANPLLTAEYATADHTDDECGLPLGVVRRGRLAQVRDHPYQRAALPAP
ncbi:Protein held out wings [Eumeta japonica]|uniref:Protein held out wings n=1 Tax=Eumeta variegata TaxID=151549 RepID=A0A4C1WF23_EUMVA|nr:Protein held out wings [Eumeta japonica]